MTTLLPGAGPAGAERGSEAESAAADAGSGGSLGMPETHAVTNQVPPLVGHDVVADPPLLEAVARENAAWCIDDLHRLGRLAGSEQA